LLPITVVHYRDSSLNEPVQNCHSLPYLYLKYDFFRWLNRNFLKFLASRLIFVHETGKIFKLLNTSCVCGGATVMLFTLSNYNRDKIPFPGHCFLRGNPPDDATAHQIEILHVINHKYKPNGAYASVFL